MNFDERTKLRFKFEQRTAVAEPNLEDSQWARTLTDALRDEGHAVSYAVLRAPLEVCLARVQGREGEPSIEAGPIEQLWRSFADLGDLERHVLEVDGMAPERVSDELAERLSGGSLRA